MDLNMCAPRDGVGGLLRERDLAQRWFKSVRTLQRWRQTGTGPAHLRIGGSVFYHATDVLAFEQAARRGGASA